MEFGGGLGEAEVEVGGGEVGVGLGEGGGAVARLGLRVGEVLVVDLGGVFVGGREEVGLFGRRWE